MPKIKIKTNSFALIASIEQHKKLALRAGADALNRTMKTVNVEINKAVQEDYTAKTTGLRRRQVIKRATAKKLRAETLISTDPLSLNRFKTRKTKKGIKVQVRKDSAGGVLPASFKAIGKSVEHIWQRAERFKSFDPFSSAADIEDVETTHSGTPFVGRLPIRPLFGPSLGQMIRKEKNEGIVQEVVDKVFLVRFRQRLKFLVSQKKKRRRR